MTKYDVSELDMRLVMAVISQMKRSDRYSICNPDVGVIGTISDYNGHFKDDITKTWEASFKKTLKFTKIKNEDAYKIKEKEIKDGSKKDGRKRRSKGKESALSESTGDMEEQ